MTPGDDARFTASEGFLAELNGLPLDELLGREGAMSEAEARRALADTPLGLEDAARLLRAPAEPLLDALIERAREVTRRDFGRSVLLFAPCDLSRFCLNSCRSCGLSIDRSRDRSWSSPPRAAHEVAVLARRGFRRIVLVAGDSPSIASPGYFVDVIERARAIVPEVDLEIGSCDEGEYALYREAGAGGVVCFQETYDRDAYAQQHPAGPKARFGHRLETLERAPRAGIRSLGLGVLLGLADPAREALVLIAHARALSRIAPCSTISVSIPRLSPGAGPSGRPGRRVGDGDLLRLFAVLRLALPAEGLVVSTREPEWMRHRLLMAGATHLSAAAVSMQASWVECPHDDGMNRTLDLRTASEVQWDLEDIGYAARWTARPAA